MDKVEADLLEAIRRTPSDAATRQVYADWLEQHGFHTRAGFLRSDPSEDGKEPASDADWRAVTSRAPIDRCVQFEFQCPKQWDALAPTEVDAVRFCNACSKQVFFCKSVEEAHLRGMRRECIAIDGAVARGAALTRYDEAVRPQYPMMMGVVAPRRDYDLQPPDPIRVPKKRTLMQRLFGRK